jgi:ribosomal protein S18 acetylase RimI-like enzyme
VIERDGQIVAYQVTSSNGMYAHLARLAVLPELQGQKLGFALVQNLLDYYINQLNLWGVTLNTQSDNASSMALYHRIGFQETGERFPVYIYG